MTLPQAIFLAIVLIVFGTLNAISIAGFRRAHPRWTRLFVALAVVSNLFWLCLPFVFRKRSNATARFLRALLAPPWFSWLVFVLLYSAVIAIAWLLWLAAGRWRGRKFDPFARALSKPFLIVMLFIAIVGFVQNLFTLHVTRQQIALKNLPPAFEGAKVALISDLHVGLFSRSSRIRYIADRAVALKPDFIIVAGDNIDDDPYFIPKFLTAFKDVPASIPMYTVLGNHEMYGDPHEAIRLMRGARPELLLNRGTVLRRGNGELWIAGVSDYAAVNMPALRDLKPNLLASLSGRPDDAMPIVVSHQPRVFPDAKKAGVPLSLSGHTHGGQFGFRFLRWTLAGVFVKYDIGLYEEDGCKLYVTTGAGYWVVPIRFGINPEIALLELRRQ